MKTTALAALVAGSVMLAGAAVAQDKTYTIGVSVPTADHGWTGGVDFFAQQAVDRLSKAYPNLKFVLATAPDSTKQAADLEDMLATRNIDAPRHPAGRSGRDDRLDQEGQGRRQVGDGHRPRSSASRASRTSTSPATTRASAPPRPTYFKQALPNGGNIVVLRGLPIPIDKQRVDAFMAGIQGTNIKVLDSQFANWNRDDGYKVMQDFLTKYPQHRCGLGAGRRHPGRRAQGGQGSRA